MPRCGATLSVAEGATRCSALQRYRLQKVGPHANVRLEREVRLGMEIECEYIVKLERYARTHARTTSDIESERVGDGAVALRAYVHAPARPRRYYQSDDTLFLLLEVRATAHARAARA
jgi:hypothetical protein